MFNLEIGQELEFMEPATTMEGRVIPKGTRVRVGSTLSQVLEQEVTLVLHGAKPPETLTVAKHIVTMHCRPV